MIVDDFALSYLPIRLRQLSRLAEVGAVGTASEARALVVHCHRCAAELIEQAIALEAALREDDVPKAVFGVLGRVELHADKEAEERREKFAGILDAMEAKDRERDPEGHARIAVLVAAKRAGKEGA